MSSEHSRKLAFALLTAVACSTSERAPSSDTLTSRMSGDSAPVTTHEMTQGLTRDVGEADRAVAAVEESIYVFMGDTVTVLMKLARARWEQYRELQCDAIRVAFAEGTMAPIAQMQCWIDLTDDRRRILVEQYDYMRNGGPRVERTP